jgi:hypothetical protein
VILGNGRASAWIVTSSEYSERHQDDEVHVFQHFISTPARYGSFDFKSL